MTLGDLIIALQRHAQEFGNNVDVSFATSYHDPEEGTVEVIDDLAYVDVIPSVQGLGYPAIQIVGENHRFYKGGK